MSESDCLCLTRTLLMRTYRHTHETKTFLLLPAYIWAWMCRGSPRPEKYFRGSFSLKMLKNTVKCSWASPQVPWGNKMASNLFLKPRNQCFLKKCGPKTPHFDQGSAKSKLFAQYWIYFQTLRTRSLLVIAFCLLKKYRVFSWKTIDINNGFHTVLFTQFDKHSTRVSIVIFHKVNIEKFNPMQTKTLWESSIIFKRAPQNKKLK